MMIGIATGGTYTDAVVFDEGRGVVAKALTTRRGLALGTAAAMDASASAPASPVTNVIVEGRGRLLPLRP